MHGSLQALPRPASAIDPSCQYGAHVSSTPTPVIRRPRPAPSPMPGRPGSWVQRYNRRPVTVSIDDTLSGNSLLSAQNILAVDSKLEDLNGIVTHHWHCSAMLGRAPWLCRRRHSRAGGGNQGRRLASSPYLGRICHGLPYCCAPDFPALTSPKKRLR